MLLFNSSFLKVSMKTDPKKASVNQTLIRIIMIESDITKS